MNPQVVRDSMTKPWGTGVEIRPPLEDGDARVLAPGAVEFLAALHRRFNPTRTDLLRRRMERQSRFDRGETVDFLRETREVREASWKIGPVPADLADRRVEITGFGMAMAFKNQPEWFM